MTTNQEALTAPVTAKPEPQIPQLPTYHMPTREQILAAKRITSTRSYSIQEAYTKFGEQGLVLWLHQFASNLQQEIYNEQVRKQKADSNRTGDSGASFVPSFVSRHVGREKVDNAGLGIADRPSEV